MLISFSFRHDQGYRLKLNRNRPRSDVVVVLALLVGLVVIPGQCRAEDSSSWWGSASWFDWSDFRLETGTRIYMASLTSGSLSRPGYEADLITDLGFRSDPEQWREVWFALYIDRLAIRFHHDEERIFRGRSREETPHTVSMLDISSLRFGFDVDVIRYPFFKCGVNFDYTNEPPKLFDRSLSAGQDVIDLTSNIGVPYGYFGAEMYTIGAHARAIPIRIREVPVVIRGRARFPLPFMDTRPTHSELMTFEVAGGLRPAIWETSLLGHSTFSFSIDVGFRFERMFTILQRQDVRFKAQWQGPFVQVLLVY
jgi:hypothetical protein